MFCFYRFAFFSYNLFLLPDLEPKKLGEPWLFTYEQLKNLLAEGARGFLFMVTCDTGNVVSVTDTVSRVLNRSQEDWLGTTIYDQVHPSDIGKIREQLSIDRNYGRTLDLRTATMRDAGMKKEKPNPVFFSTHEIFFSVRNSFSNYCISFIDSVTCIGCLERRLCSPL